MHFFLLFYWAPGVNSARNTELAEEAQQVFAEGSTAIQVSCLL